MPRSFKCLPGFDTRTCPQCGNGWSIELAPGETDAAEVFDALGVCPRCKPRSTTDALALFPVYVPGEWRRSR